MRLLCAGVLRTGLLWLAVPAAVLSAAGLTAGGESVRLARPLPSLVRVGDRVTVSGRLTRRPMGNPVAALEARGPGAPWHSLARDPVGSAGGFTLHWRVRRSPDAVLLSLRVAVLRRGVVLAATRPVQSAIGPAAVRCAPPVPPAVNIPVGDGWIVGGLYIRGGPFPGIDECASQAYTITAIDAGGQVAASQTVSGRRSYTLVVPAGTYTLKVRGGCGLGSSVTVRPAHQTAADTYCDVP